MTMHLYGIVITPFGTASNNRGEAEGNLSTLQKILWNNRVHSTVSAEAIRWAIRHFWQSNGEDVNRTWDDDSRSNVWQDHGFSKASPGYLDDDVLGYMSAEAGKVDGGETEVKGKARGTTKVRRSRLEVTRAISLTPWPGDILFNAASIGATPSASTTGKDPVPYSVEVHATRYQYGFALTPESLSKRERALDVLAAVSNMKEVAGNHGRFLYDFSPDSVIYRWTDDFAPRLLYGFEADLEGKLSLPMLLRRVTSGDIAAEELVVGGSIADTDDGRAMAKLGAWVDAGVKRAEAEVGQRMRQALGL